MTLFRAGARVDRPPGPKYVSQLSFAELAPRAPLPKPATLARFRRSLPAGFELSLVAPRETMLGEGGPFRAGPKLDEGIAWLTAAVEALEPIALVVPTAGEVTTGPRDRARLMEFFDRLPRREGTAIVWAPSGLWEQDVAIPFADELDVVWGGDPLENAVPEDDMAYAQLRAIGLRNRFGEGMLIEALEAVLLSGAERAYIAVDSPRAVKEAARLTQLAAELAETLSAGDDEDDEDGEDLEGEDLEDDDEDEDLGDDDEDLDDDDDEGFDDDDDEGFDDDEDEE